MYKQYQKDRYKNYKLLYFNLRGRGEGIRYMLAAAEIKFEDKRIPSESWKDMKESTPFGHLPVLDVDGVQISEGTAIARFVARMGGLDGETPTDQALIDSIVETSTEVREAVVSIMLKPGEKEEKESAREEYFKDKGKTTLEKLQAIVQKCDDYEKNGKCYFVGEKLSFADIWFYHCLELVVITGGTDVLKPFPKLETIYKTVETTPSIQEYMKNRPETPY